MTLRPLIFTVASILLFSACGGGEEPTPAEFRFSNDRTAFENEANSVFSFDVRIDEAKTEEVRVQYATVDGSATAGEDYIATLGTLSLRARRRSPSRWRSSSTSGWNRTRTSSWP